MNFDKLYWLFIAAAMISAAIASACTLWLFSTGHTRECNTLAIFCFSRIGMVPGMMLGILALLPIMIAIPYILRQNERPGLLSVLILGCIVAYTAFDAVNDISAIMGYQHAFLIAHSILDTTNNLTGSFVGTGASVC